MACTFSQVTTTTTPRADGGLRRSFSNKDLQGRAGMRRSLSDNHLCYSISTARASMVQPKLKNSRSSVGFFNIQLPGAMIPNALKSFLFDSETSKEMNMEDTSGESDHEDLMEIDKAKKRVNWIERLVELRKNWKEKQDDVEEYVGRDYEGCDEEGGCEVEYGEDEEGNEIGIDRDIFSSLLRHVSWSDTKLFSQLAFLCNMAYIIPDIKTEDLRRYYGLEFVTSSLEKKEAAAAIKDKVDHDSTRVSISSPETITTPITESPRAKPPARLRSSAAYEIAASAASYVQSQAKDLISEPELSGDGIYKSEMAACVAASAMTAVVAAGEEEKERAAKDLQSLHSSPCEWFVCDDSSIYSRCFIIQGSDSLASWQANLFFEPAKFEGTNVLVHRGIYEAAKGIYDQFMPEIKQHLNRFGDRAKLQFTGHSLGGSLALLVNLMLLMRKEVKASALLPVVTFGSPFVFCGGEKILDHLGVDENHVHCVMMHRDIVPRAFSCNYPSYVAQVLKRLNGTFRNHPCLNKNKLLYSPMGKMFILQPDEKSSPPHPLLPLGSAPALYTLNNTNISLTKSALRAFLNSPHPIETLSDPTAYGSEGTILRDHDSSNYLKAVNEVIRQHMRLVVRKERKQRNQLWPLLTSRSPHAWSHTCNIEGRGEVSEKILSGV
ncbi:hypothetical protein BUALT_Bualt19G0003900 [Buddleja alternifolia]|uniref:Fungal lipase-type domain-containing protein n=1 Tax=Buddleja alternifolia TaxID=168488 RepID=A0AAV6W4M2_9LAMI|nr:hypothetical protein BUALT_Bualt19G0003900 [Buddleja alternifolia]